MAVSQPKEGYIPIEEHGAIGNMKTLALVGSQGTIDWFCFPHFDSPSIFGGILDCNRGGYWKISVGPEDELRNVKQHYWPDTNILVTKFFTNKAIGQIIDYMPLHTDKEKRKDLNCIIRKVSIRSGDKMTFKMEFLPAFDYGRCSHSVKLKVDDKNSQALFETPGDHIHLRLDTGKLQLTEEDISDGGLKLKGKGIVKNFELNFGQTQTFIMTACNSEKYRTVTQEEEEALYRETEDFWRSWLRQCNYHGRWVETIHRSVLALKLLTFEETGAIISAGTTSLPSSIGGTRNFDMRYTWIRNASFTLYALLRVGFTTEAEKFMEFLSKILKRGGDDEMGPLYPVYRIDGRVADMGETTLDHLEGYKGSAPVRIGVCNPGLQLDIYGALMDSIYLYNKYAAPVTWDMWLNVRHLVDWICENWNKPDEGIWEMRGAKHDHVHSKVMCWVAVDRGLRLAVKRSFPIEQNTCDKEGDKHKGHKKLSREMWLRERDKIFEDVMTKGWNGDMRSFTQFYGSKNLDASNLMMPLLLFLSGDDPRMIQTIDAIEKPVEAGGLSNSTMVYRYNVKETNDGLEGPEGMQTICSFWLVECLTRMGAHWKDKMREARYKLEDMFSYANHVGLYSAQLGVTGRQLGNFPDGFAHIALISATFNLNRAIPRH